jgi:hypothetical protein
MTVSFVSARSVRMAATLAGVALAAAAAGCGSSGSGSSAKGIQFPAKVASLQKSADQSTAKSVLSGLKGASRKEIHAVSYEDSSDSSRKVLVYGGTGVPVPPGDPATQLKKLLANGSSGVKASSVAPGSVGGTAECAALSQVKLVNCGWISGKSALVMTFQGFDKGSAQSLVPKVLAAMVQT